MNRTIVLRRRVMYAQVEYVVVDETTGLVDPRRFADYSSATQYAQSSANKYATRADQYLARDKMDDGGQWIVVCAKTGKRMSDPLTLQEAAVYASRIAQTQNVDLWSIFGRWVIVCAQTGKRVSGYMAFAAASNHAKRMTRVDVISPIGQWVLVREGTNEVLSQSMSITDAAAQAKTHVNGQRVCLHSIAYLQVPSRGSHTQYSNEL